MVGARVGRRREPARLHTRASFLAYPTRAWGHFVPDLATRDLGSIPSEVGQSQEKR
jgi:hypothetical protein